MGLAPEFSAMTVLAVIVLAIIIFGTAYFMNKICYMSEEGQLRCEFNFNKHKDSSVLSAVKCSYYCCQFGLGSPKLISLKSWKYEDEMVSCLDFCKGGPMCGKASPIKISISPDSNVEIERDSWLKIVEGGGVKNSEDYASLIKSTECGPIGYIKGKIFGFIPLGKKNSNPAALVFPENSVCKFYWLNGLGVNKQVSKKACSLRTGNYEIWTERADNNDNYDIIICQEGKLSEGSGGGF